MLNAKTTCISSWECFGAVIIVCTFWELSNRQTVHGFRSSTSFPVYKLAALFTLTMYPNGFLLTVHRRQVRPFSLIPTPCLCIIPVVPEVRLNVTLSISFVSSPSGKTRGSADVGKDQVGGGRIGEGGGVWLEDLGELGWKLDFRWILEGPSHLKLTISSLIPQQFFIFLQETCSEMSTNL